MRKIKHNAGFTLIETMLYIALFAIIIGGAIVTAYSIIESGGKNEAKFQVQEEANFLLRKINWALTGADSLSTTASPPTLTVHKGVTTLVFSLNVASASLQLKTNAAAPVPLSSRNVVIASLSFQPSTIGTLNAVRSTFTVNGEKFETTKYLRK